MTDGESCVKHEREHERRKRRQQSHETNVRNHPLSVQNLESMAKTSNAPNSSEDEVAVLENARLDIDSFAVELPQEPAAAAAVGNHRGVVGTIVFLKKSAMVWFGWGDLQKGAADASTSTAKNASVGSGKKQPTNQLNFIDLVVIL